MAGTLYLVATPIGNLEDISRRALRVLSEVDLIACEDTRHTKKLLDHFGIRTKTISYHEHNERERASELIERLEAGANVAVVTDAGTPGISDPGFRLVQLAPEAGVRVVPIPGPNALTAALAGSGLPTDEFLFAGFLPARGGERRSVYESLRSIPATLIFYEAPHRIAASLRDAHDILGERQAVVARELTKLHEEFVRGTLSELAKHFSGPNAARGEMVLLIDRERNESVGTEKAIEVSALVEKFAAQGLDQRAALKKAARELGLPRAEAYRRLLAERAKNIKL